MTRQEVTITASEVSRLTGKWPTTAAAFEAAMEDPRVQALIRRKAQAGDRSSRTVEQAARYERMHGPLGPEPEGP